MKRFSARPPGTHSAPKTLKAPTSAPAPPTARCTNKVEIQMSTSHSVKKGLMGCCNLCLLLRKITTLHRTIQKKIPHCFVRYPGFGSFNRRSFFMQPMSTTTICLPLPMHASFYALQSVLYKHSPFLFFFIIFSGKGAVQKHSPLLFVAQITKMNDE